MSVKINYRMVDSTNRVVRCGKRKMIAMEWIPWQEGTIKVTSSNTPPEVKTEALGDRLTKRLAEVKVLDDCYLSV